jgi:hypothetical protein
MIIPPFKSFGESDAEFYCLAFTSVIYCPTRASEMPASLGIYYCEHAAFARFSRISYADKERHLSYTRGDESNDTLEFILLLTLTESSIHPATWRLFPRIDIPSDFRCAGYDAARRHLCTLLFSFRTRELATQSTKDFPHKPLMVSDGSVERIAFGDSKEEDAEIEKAIMGK